MTDHIVRRGEAAEGPFSLVITPKTAGWGYSSLRILELEAGGSATFATGEDEAVVLPLAGGPDNALVRATRVCQEGCTRSTMD